MLMIDMTSTINSVSEVEKVEKLIFDIAQKDGRGALEQLYLLIKDIIYGYALSHLKNTHDAEDVLHDCFISIYQSAHRYVPSGKPMAWIFTITRNLCLTKLRARSRFSDLPEEDWEKHLQTDDCISISNKMTLEHCMRDLADDEREILLLHALSGLKHREIAELTNHPLSTILSKYHRALKKMRASLKEEDR